MNIFVGNLPNELTEDELRQEFTTFGDVLSIIIMRSNYIGSNYSNRYGYVEMVSGTEAKTAIRNLSNKIIKGKVIKIIEALPLSKSEVKLPNRVISRFSRYDSVRAYEARRQEHNGN
ncbi:MAG: RNA-binding protein [Dehalococcoidales bacterium]|nr:RNA-binding protein [Dehalococcoidales bacterium]